MQDKRPETRYEFKLNFKEITLFIVGSIGVISLFFIIGIWIGKSLNAIPTEMISEEYLTERDFPEAEEAGEETELDVSKKDDETSYDFQGTLSGEGITPLKEDNKVKIIKGDNKVTNKAITAKKEIDNFTVPGSKKKEEPKPAVARAKKVDTKKPPKKGRYTVQIASLKSDQAALNLKNKLKQKGYDAYFEATDLKGKGVWYRVKVGNFSSKADAKKVIAKVEKSIKIKGMIVKDTRN
jgi:cell division septation protein DedD